MRKLLIPVALLMATLITNCAKTVSEQEANDNLLLGLVGGAALASSADFALNGAWNSFTGNGTTSNTITTIGVDAGQTGVWLDDSSDFGGFSSCYRVVEFSNSGSVITQNPENNGACFTGDTNQGKYNKIFFFSATFENRSVIWYCTVGFGIADLETARTTEDTASRSDPTATNSCGAGTWTRLERL